ncbi:hypothetical protein PVK06_024694 [Gossypium arboreum]|uniref:RNase H type-1 domain-containing protein n=1 Tax=Gossypium arboreum TaxID=29729 RepID=A0ABR0PEH9_GOSAR|nr:hypothetical protein PVK06_024694 [Gossypium arboreum]
MHVFGKSRPLGNFVSKVLAATGYPRKAEARALIRNHDGKWIVGSYRHIPRSTRVEAELWALRDGLQLAKNLNLERVEIEVNATIVIHFMT